MRNGGGWYGFIVAISTSITDFSLTKSRQSADSMICPNSSFLEHKSRIKEVNSKVKRATDKA